jgi:hypothetical protein
MTFTSLALKLLGLSQINLSWLVSSRYDENQQFLMLICNLLLAYLQSKNLRGLNLFYPESLVLMINYLLGRILLLPYQAKISRLHFFCLQFCFFEIYRIEFQIFQHVHLKIYYHIILLFLHQILLLFVLIFMLISWKFC